MRRLRPVRRWKKPARPARPAPPAPRPADPAALDNPYAPCYRPARSLAGLRKNTK